MALLGIRPRVCALFAVLLLLLSIIGVNAQEECDFSARIEEDCSLFEDTYDASLYDVVIAGSMFVFSST